MMRALALFLASVPALGLLELGLHEYFARRAPREADYAALGPKLLAFKPRGVPVVVSPAWAEPLVRQAAPAAFPMGELTRADLAKFPAFVEVSLLGEHARSDFAFGRRESVGPFTLAIRENPRPEPTLFDFVTAVDLGEAEVFSELDGQRMPCPPVVRDRPSTGGLHGHVAYPRRRYECPGNRLVAVSLIEDASYAPHRCVLVQLPGTGSVVVRASGVPASPRFVGYAGSSYFLERDFPGDVRLGIDDGGAELSDVHARGAAWSRFEAARRPGTGLVELTIRREAGRSSDFCFALEAR
jgi:hypothetical protein